MTFYALYKGDTFITITDTIQEMADYMYIKFNSARWLSYPDAHRWQAGKDAQLIYKYKLEEI
ncbi:hypothetical protein LFYK43_10910 [Ligilactobacillus salitolerans]|uniref:Uncharacterized protein n=1 Tax=Ligilactobacillus salitolerans TaxID=1808352 RepID=A0A401ISW9_9LACO|nr:hypothetical protein [Ligilactobacillus salitolerans]GBG94632.1 hypothetical protein LFYK43_10910 [Ligilactobacillus salitolerans]